MRVVILGGGAWGSAFATVLREHGHEVALAFRDPEQAAATATAGVNERYLPGIRLGGIELTTFADADVESANLVVAAVPSKSFGSVVSGIAGDAPILSLTKGLDPTTGGRLSELVRDRPFAVLSGPNIAGEIARG